MASYDEEAVPRDREASLRDRVAQLEKANHGLGEMLDEVRRQVKRIMTEVGID
jgi:hypothetical protein